MDPETVDRAMAGRPGSVADLVRAMRALLAGLPATSALGAEEVTMLREAAELVRQAVARAGGVPPAGHSAAGDVPGGPEDSGPEQRGG